MVATRIVYSRNEITQLAERLDRRGGSLSRMNFPEMCRDMLMGAALLRWMLDQGMPPQKAEIEVHENGWPTI